MAKATEILRERLRERVEKSGQSPRALSLAIGANHSYVSQLLNGSGGMPSAARLRQLADQLGTTVEYFMGEAANPAQIGSDVILGDPIPNWQGPEPSGPGIPLMGTGDCADIELCDESGALIAIERSSFDDEFPIRMITRPPALRNARDIYAIYFQGDSMIPRFEPGELGIVDPRRPVRAGEYALVQLNDGANDAVQSVLVKRVVRQNADELVLEQFNPPVVFKVPKSRVARIHRILQQTDLLFG